MKKYAVICYAIHNQEIASCDWFDSLDDAINFLSEDAEDTYEEEVDSSGRDDVFLEKDSRFACLCSHNNEYIWTWEICKFEDDD